MKKTRLFILKVLVIILFSCVNKALAQNKSKSSLYLDFGLELGNYFGADLNLNYVFSNRYSAHLGVTALNIRAENVPDGYGGGLESLFSLGFSAARERLFNFRMGAGRVFWLNTKGSLRIHPQVGLGIAIVQEPYNFSFNGSIPVSENYDYDFKSITIPSLHINPVIEYSFSGTNGLSFSPKMILNREEIYYGVGIHVIIGEL